MSGLATANSQAIAAAVVRFSWVTVTVLTAVYIGYASMHGTNAGNASSGGMGGCFKCPNGWNWHVLLNTLAFTIFMGESLLAFLAPLRALGSRATQMYWHLALQTAALGLTWVGLIAIVVTKVAQVYLSMYSVHAWCGAIVLVLFTAQYILGLCAFVFKSTLGKSQTFRKWHSFSGFLTFFAGIETCVNGWADMQMMNVDFGQPSYGSATMLGSGSAMAFWLLAAAVAYLLASSPPRRSGQAVQLEETKSAKPEQSA